MDFFTDGTTDQHRYYNIEEFSVAARYDDHIGIKVYKNHAYCVFHTSINKRYVCLLSLDLRCACNGHAVRCSLDASAICECTHNTQGNSVS